LKSVIEIASLPFLCRWEELPHASGPAYPTKAKVPCLPGQGRGESDGLRLCLGSCFNFLLNLINFSKYAMERQVASLLMDWQSCAALIFCSQKRKQNI